MIKLKGKVNQEIQTFEFAGQEFIARSSEEYPLNTIPRLWATRKIGHLLNQIRLKGPDKEIIEQIVRLSIRYGIVTPYTSYLVTEEQPLGETEQERIASEQYNQMLGMPTAPVSGQGAVEKAADQSSLEAAQAPAAPDQETANKIRVAGSKAFVFDGKQWVDTIFNPESMSTEKVVFLSPEYYALVDSRPELASAFALGQEVIVVLEGTAYQVVPEGTPSQPVTIPPTYTPAATDLPAEVITDTPTSVTPPVAPDVPLPPTPTPLSSNTPTCASILFPFIFLAAYTFHKSKKLTTNFTNK